DDEPLDPRGLPRRKQKSRHSTHRLTNNGGALPAQAVKGGSNIVDQCLGPKPVGGGRTAISPLVQRDDIMGSRQCPGEMLPAVGIGREPVEQEDRWPAEVPPLQRVGIPPAQVEAQASGSIGPPFRVGENVVVRHDQVLASALRPATADADAVTAVPNPWVSSNS